MRNTSVKSLPPSLTLPHKGGGDYDVASAGTPSPLMGEGGEGVIATPPKKSAS